MGSSDALRSALQQPEAVQSPEGKDRAWRGEAPSDHDRDQLVRFGRDRSETKTRIHVGEESQALIWGRGQEGPVLSCRIRRGE